VTNEKHVNGVLFLCHAIDSGLSAHPPSLLQRFLNVLEQEREGKLTVEQVARKLNMSPSHLSRLIKMTTGRSPSEHIRVSKLKARARAAGRCLGNPGSFGKRVLASELLHCLIPEVSGRNSRRLQAAPRPAMGKIHRPNQSQISGIPSSKEGIVPRNGGVA